MYKVLQATYENGNLILKEKLSSDMEGKTLKVIIVETDELEAKKERFFNLVDSHSFALPENYHFDREELHGR
ncbi:antitoxin AF2212-like protein [Chlorogloeopsis sp. ULAP02]|uniref:antitoxin AF2212-like protein n=1 Tax=Chlorogloeopsis sp. ULAP02 TaxID=3107926 RepID=UPI0031372518